MSFLRPGAAAALRRWGEPAGVALALALTLWQAAVWLDEGAPFGWFALVAAALLALWLRAALAGSIGRRDRAGPGVVVLREGEIGYMGPESGGFLELREIERVEIVNPARGDLLWYLDAGPSGRLIFPASAKGADAVVEALAPLPGFSDLAAAQTLRAPPLGRSVVWQRQSHPRIEAR